jgi:transposase
MRPYGSQQSFERRRRQAVALLAQGLGPHEVARRGRAAMGSGSRWYNAWRQGGEAAFAAKPVPGAPRKLLDQPREPLLPLLMHGARANGFPTELWTLNRMTAVMQVHVGVRYHPAPVWKLLRHLGWSGQVPERRALQRDEAVITHGKRYQWPAIKKRPVPGRPSGLPG